MILEAIVDQSLWIWHAFFGMPGGNNDINVLDRSPLVVDLLRGEGQDLAFEVNGSVYPHYYLLIDGIYPQWSCFVQPIHEPQDKKRTHYTKMQEGARKDIERAFGVLQARWVILQNPVRQWDMDVICDIMYACIVLHNMIVQDEAGLNLEPIFDQGIAGGRLRCDLSFQKLREGTIYIENMTAHGNCGGSPGTDIPGFL
jgi:hypothetical protein